MKSVGVLLAAVFAVGFCAVQHAWGVQRYVLRASDGDTNDMLGADVALGDGFIVAGAPKDINYTNNTVGEAYIFALQGTDWVQQAVLQAGDASDYDQFGIAVGAGEGIVIVGATRPNNFAGGLAYVFVCQGTNWVQQGRLSHPDTLGWSFGEAVDIDGDHAVVGARTGETNGQDCGVVFVYERTGTNWVESAMVAPSDGVSGDWFGHSVGISWPYLIVGADGRSNFAGGAYIFRCGPSNDWMEEAIINDPDATNLDYFGQCVDIDGDYAIVGTSHEQRGAYLYHREGTTWVLQAVLEDVHPRSGSGTGFYGDWVAIKGEYALVGGDSYAILFKRSGTNWIKQIRVGNSDWELTDTTLAVDKDWIVAGCDSDDGLADNAGAVYVVEVDDRNRQSELIPTNQTTIRYIGSGLAVDSDIALVGGQYGGTNDHGYCGVHLYNGVWWPVVCQLIPQDATNGQKFGTSVDLKGEYAVVGAPGDDQIAEDAGAAYVFYMFRDASNWVQQAKLVNTGLTANAAMGTAVATDGGYTLVGAPNQGAGRVYVFARSDTNWTFSSLLTGQVYAAQFGEALDYDGTLAVVGSPNETLGTNTGAGSAYIFTRSGSSWSQGTRITSTNPCYMGAFGSAVGIHGQWCAVGEPSAGLTLGDQFGAVHVFRLVGTVWVPWQTLYSPHPETNGYFGSSVALVWPYLMVGARGENRGYIYSVSAGTNWVLLAQIEGGDTETTETFGTSAALSTNYGMMAMAAEYSAKAYLFYAESFDLPPEIVGISAVTGGVQVTIDRLVPGFLGRVERSLAITGSTWQTVEDFPCSCERTSRVESVTVGAGEEFYRAMRW